MTTSADEEEGEAEAAAAAESGGEGEGPPAAAAAAAASPPREGGVARRTRAHLSLRETELEELERFLTARAPPPFPPPRSRARPVRP